MWYQLSLRAHGLYVKLDSIRTLLITRIASWKV